MHCLLCFNINQATGKHYWVIRWCFSFSYQGHKSYKKGPLLFVVVESWNLTILLFYSTRRDKEVNRQRYERIVLDSPDGAYLPFQTEHVSGSALRVGDIVMLHKGQRVPADMILLRTNETMGTVFIRTDQLDGEIDWKLRWVLGLEHFILRFDGIGCFDASWLYMFWCKLALHSMLLLRRRRHSIYRNKLPIGKQIQDS